MNDLFLPAVHDAFEPTPAAAHARIDALDPARYARTRNHLDGAVSRLSPYLTHGLVDVPSVIARLGQRHALTPADKIVFELAWREYFHHLWRHWGDGILSARRPAPAARYAAEVPADVREGRTGVPVIDASVRTLYDTGYLHNHARMWLASYLVHLRKTGWLAGATWMYRHLLDGDLASNMLSWQWVAGTLTGKPYLFNAENVARYAPALASQGTAIDDSYESLDRRARHAADCGPEPGAHTGIEAPDTAAPPAESATLPTSADPVWLVHPWSLGEVPPGHVAVGWIEPGFHARFGWSAARWAFVAARMRVLCDSVVVGNADRLRLLWPTARLSAQATLNPFYAEALRDARVTLQPVPRQFDDPPRPQPSFSRFWQTVAPDASTARPWHR